MSRRLKPSGPYVPKVMVAWSGLAIRLLIETNKCLERVRADYLPDTLQEQLARWRCRWRHTAEAEVAGNLRLPSCRQVLGCPAQQVVHALLSRCGEHGNCQAVRVKRLLEGAAGRRDQA